MIIETKGIARLIRFLPPESLLPAVDANLLLRMLPESARNEVIKFVRSLPDNEIVKLLSQGSNGEAEGAPTTPAAAAAPKKRGRPKKESSEKASSEKSEKKENGAKARKSTPSMGEGSDAIVEFVTKNGLVSIGTISEKLGIDKAVAARMIKGLVTIGRFVQKGKKRGTAYQINPKWNHAGA